MTTEFEFITNLRKKTAGSANSISRIGIGDDCAVLPKDAKTDLVVTADLLVEDIDFRLEWTTPEFIGHKALAVSLSDIAAMGAKPVWSMTSIGIPEKIWKTGFVEKFYEGYLNLAKEYGVELVGGDVSKTTDKIVIDSIVAGEVEKGKAVLRSGAKIGDSIFVTGALGGASAGLKLLESGEKFETATGWRRKLIDRQLKPVPRLKPVEFQKFPQPYISDDELKNITSMIDISDGLSSDLAHICRASGVGAKIFAEKIPLLKHLRAMTKDFDERLAFALHGGEDFELLYTKSSKKISAPENVDFGSIGVITANAGIIELIVDGESRVLDEKGYRHF
jgi:thiamine-monophosphate kinase